MNEVTALIFYPATQHVEVIAIAEIIERHPIATSVGAMVIANVGGVRWLLNALRVGSRADH